MEGLGVAMGAVPSRLSGIAAGVCRGCSNMVAAQDAGYYVVTPGDGPKPAEDRQIPGMADRLGRRRGVRCHPGDSRRQAATFSTCTS